LLDKRREGKGWRREEEGGGGGDERRRRKRRKRKAVGRHALYC